VNQVGMAPRAGIYALDQLSWTDVAAHLAHDARLILPVGALEQHGPHLPLGTNVLIARSAAIDLSDEFSVLRAPSVPYGVNVDADRAFAGTASMRRKTLHRALNELLADWEGHGVREFILITAHRHEPHLDALATLFAASARLRVVQIWDVDLADLLEEQRVPLHGGEAETSVMLHLYPELVRLERARDVDLPAELFRSYLGGELTMPPAGSPGSVGRPTSATAEKGARIYERILAAIRGAVFLDPGDDETDAV
jgi:creatinine amidohydrolase